MTTRNAAISGILGRIERLERDAAKLEKVFRGDSAGHALACIARELEAIRHQLRAITPEQTHVAPRLTTRQEVAR